MRKRRLLVVAPGLPEFDRNAGSRRLYSWLRILATEYDIAFYMLHRRIGGDSKRYAQALTALGVKIHAPQETVLELLARQIDHGVLFEFFHTAERLLPYLRLLRPDMPMVVSCADLHYVRESRAAVYADHPVRAKAGAVPSAPGEVGHVRVWGLSHVAPHPTAPLRPGPRPTPFVRTTLRSSSS